MYKKFLKGYPIQVLSSFIVSFGTFAFGFGYLWMAPAIPKLLLNNGNSSEDTFVQITDTQASWIASIHLITVPFSSIGTIFLANYFGTKNILVIAPIPLIISWLLIYFAQNIWYFYISRLMVGISDSFFYNCGSVYIGEISDPKIRGVLLFLIPIMFNVGGLITYYFGYVLSLKKFAFLSIIPAVIYFILFLGMPHSPYYFIIKQKYDKAEATLRLLRDKDYTDGETEVLRNAVEHEMSNKVNLKFLLNNVAYRKSFGIVLMTMIFQQLSGVTTVASYIHLLINESDVNISTDILALIAGTMTVLGSLSSTIWIDRQGRRPLILVSMFSSGVSMMLLGIYFLLKERGYDLVQYQWIPSTLLAIYQFFVNFGVINMPFLLAGELFSTNTKNYGSSTALVSFGVFGFITNKIFLFISNNFGMSLNLFGFSFFSFIGFMCFYFYLPETRYKTLAEIQEMLQNKKNSSREENNVSKTSI